MAKLLLLSIVLLALGALLRSCTAQDLQYLDAAFQQHYSNLQALQLYKNNSEVFDEGLKALNELWMVQAPELMQYSTMGFSESCRNSTLGLFESVPISMGANISFNVSIPGPKILPLLDATGKPGAGVLAGNVILNGAYDECFTVNYTSFCRADGIKVNIDSPIAKLLSFTVGFCVPKSCNNQDLALLINSLELFSVEEYTVFCTDTKYSSYSVGAIIMIVVCVIFGLLAIIGTSVDVALTEVPKLFEKEEMDEGITSINYAESANESDSMESTPLMNSQSIVKKNVPKKKVNPVEFITAFSLFKTVPTLLATKQAPGVITCLNGLRVISMFWVILGHTHFWVFIQSIVRIDNIASLFNIGKRFSFQAISSGYFSVDSFFFLSGVLVAYLTFRQMKKKGRFPFVHFYVHRYLRLTPTYAFVLFFAWFLTIHLGYGPVLTLNDPFAEGCRKYWWTNLIYINNLHPYALMDGCISWAWYLANDMQFYVITPLVLIPLYYFLPIGLLVGLVLLGAGFLITSVLTAVYDYQANTFSFLAYGYVQSNTTQYSYSDMVYTKPWNRIAPYLVGLMVGYIFFKNFRLIKIPRLVKLLIYCAMWAVAAFVMFWVVYGLYFTWHGHIPGALENNVYITFTRFLWAVGLALIVIACHNGYGWFVNSFLSMSLWTPLARMTFNAYLVHPIVMTVVYGQLQTTLHYTDITMACFFVVFVVLSYAVAGLVCIFVEFPLSSIEMLVFSLFGSKGRESQRQLMVNLGPQKDVKA